MRDHVEADSLGGSGRFRSLLVTRPSGPYTIVDSVIPASISHIKESTFWDPGFFLFFFF
jgi:hypothetical protein